jgi:hypothetical protein
VQENQNPVQGYFFENFSIPDRECRKEAIRYGAENENVRVWIVQSETGTQFFSGTVLSGRILRNGIDSAGFSGGVILFKDHIPQDSMLYEICQTSSSGRDETAIE